MTNRICKKCLIEKIDPMGVLSSVRKRVALLDETEKVSEETYQNRLVLCSECKELELGMCKLCGCFVEYRAAQIKMHCPNTTKKW